MKVGQSLAGGEIHRYDIEEHNESFDSNKRDSTRFYGIQDLPILIKSAGQVRQLDQRLGNLDLRKKRLQCRPYEGTESCWQMVATKPLAGI